MVEGALVAGGLEAPNHQQLCTAAVSRYMWYNIRFLATTEPSMIVRAPDTAKLGELSTEFDASRRKVEVQLGASWTLSVSKSAVLLSSASHKGH